MVRKFLKNQETVYDFLPSALEIIESPPSPLGKAVIVIISIFMAIIILWSCLAKIDKVVVSLGQINPVGGVKVVESNISGKISSIIQKEGDLVNEGDNIIEIDDVNSEEKEIKLLEDLEIKKLDLEIIESRIENRKVNYDIVDISEEKLEEIKLRENISLKKKNKEDEEFKSRLNEINGNIDILENKNKELQDKYANMTDIDIFLNGKETLKEIENNTNQIENLKKNKRDYTKEDELKKLETELVNKQNRNVKHEEIDSLKKNLDNLKEQKNNYFVKSPISGTILKLNYNTIGANVTTIKPVAEIVPNDVEYEIETIILNKDISKIEVGKEVVIKIESYDYQKYGTLIGKVKAISPNATMSDTKGMVYKVKVDFDLNQNPQIKILPGMNTVVEIKSEKIRIIDYFLEPFKKHVDNALKG